jgi:hypothetical protein
MQVVREKLETDKTGRAVRGIINSMFALRPGDAAIWCWDAPHSRQRRQSLYPKYKANRKPHPDNIWPMIDLIKETLQHTNAIQVMAAGYEADDVIATLVRQNPSVRKLIHSTDRDLAQLFDHQTSATFETKIAPSDIRLYKTCVGDPSDNITGIPGFGKQTWETTCKAELEQMISSVILGGDWACHPIIECLPTRVRNWLSDPVNRGELKTLWEIVGLYDVPPILMNAGLKPGVRDDAKADALLRKYMQ